MKISCLSSSMVVFELAENENELSVSARYLSLPKMSFRYLPGI